MAPGVHLLTRVHNTLMHRHAVSAMTDGAVLVPVKQRGEAGLERRRASQGIGIPHTVFYAKEPLPVAAITTCKHPLKILSGSRATSKSRS